MNRFLALLIYCLMLIAAIIEWQWLQGKIEKWIDEFPE